MQVDTHSLPGRGGAEYPDDGNLLDGVAGELGDQGVQPWVGGGLGVWWRTPVVRSHTGIGGKESVIDEIIILLTPAPLIESFPCIDADATLMP